MKRCSLIYDLMKEGCTTLCEAKLLNGKMPDILIVDSPEPIVYEILHSEKDKNLEYKREAYLGLKVIGVRT